MHSGFETGKKYQNENSQIATCLFADIEVVVMRWENNRHVFQRNPEDMKFFGLRSYVPPRKEYFNAFRMTERTLSKGNVTETRYQGPFNLEIEADYRIKDLPRGSYYGRLIMTHHSETEVTVEFHLKR